MPQQRPVPAVEGEQRVLLADPVAHPLFDEVLKIAVLRGGGLGDLIFTLPAMDALAAAYPEAEIVLLGTPGHARLLHGRPRSAMRVEPLPDFPGVHASTGDAPPAADFFRRMRAERFDLACQLHGGGRHSNPFLLALGARHTVGTRTPDAVELERWIPYLYFQHEIVRWLETVALAGASPVTWEPRIAVSLPERHAAAHRYGAPDVVIHPGATDPRRRWPAERFGQIARRCAESGYGVAVIGDSDEASLAGNVTASAHHSRVWSLAGQVPLEELAALLATAQVFIGNDSGPRHLAQAVGTASAAVFWVGNLINGGPFTRTRHRVQVSWTTRCPICGADVTRVESTRGCDHDPSFVADVETDALYADVTALLET